MPAVCSTVLSIWLFLSYCTVIISKQDVYNLHKYGYGEDGNYRVFPIGETLLLASPLSSSPLASSITGDVRVTQYFDPTKQAFFRFLYKGPGIESTIKCAQVIPDRSVEFIRKFFTTFFLVCGSVWFLRASTQPNWARTGRKNLLVFVSLASAFLLFLPGAVYQYQHYHQNHCSARCIVDPTHIEFDYLKQYLSSLPFLETALHIPSSSSPSSLSSASVIPPSSLLLHRLSPRVRVLVIGLGGGTLINFLHHYFSTLKITVVEIDPGIVQAAHDCLGFNRNGHMTTISADASQFVQQEVAQLGGPFDFIFMDTASHTANVYKRQVPPFALSTDSFLTDVTRLLAPHGVFLPYIWSRDDSALFVHRLTEHFPLVYVSTAADYEVFICSQSPALSLQTVRDSVGLFQQQSTIPTDVIDFAAYEWTRLEFPVEEMSDVLHEAELP